MEELTDELLSSVQSAGEDLHEVARVLGLTPRDLEDFIARGDANPEEVELLRELSIQLRRGARRGPSREAASQEGVPSHPGSLPRGNPKQRLHAQHESSYRSTPVRSRYGLYLARSPLFRGLSDDELELIAGLCSMRQFRPKQVIVRQDDPAGDMFIILEGHAKVIASDSEGRDAGLSTTGPNEVFGEVSLLDGAPSSVTIIALEACQMLVIEREPFHRFLEEHPRVAIHLLSIIARRLRQLTERSADIAFRTVAGRLAKRILELAEKHGREEDGARVLFRLSQQDISDLIGATRESANKHIRHWEQQGIIEYDKRGHMVIRDVEWLRSVEAGTGGRGRNDSE